MSWGWLGDVKGEFGVSTILVTGVSGFIGRNLVASLVGRGEHKVIGMSRHRPDLEAKFVFIEGEFQSFEDLRKLDEYEIDVLIHLAAVGGRNERYTMLVNVEGSRCLMRYLIDRGCRKFVLTSSIAAVGLEDPSFCPLQLPIPDEHPCFDLHGYGFSKYLMEAVTRYYHRQNSDLDVMNLRLSTILPGKSEHIVREITPGSPPIWTFATISVMYLSDTIRLLAMAAEAPHKPGVRIMNATATKIFSQQTVPEIIRAWLPNAKLDLSHYERRGHEKDSVFDVTRIGEELGFVAERLPGS